VDVTFLGKGDVYRVWVGKPERWGLIATNKPRWENIKLFLKTGWQGVDCISLDQVSVHGGLL